jgi:thioredoxin 2
MKPVSTAEGAGARLGQKPKCGPCKAMAPHFAEAAGVLEPQVRLAKLNTEVEQGLASQFGIRSIPTLALFRGGREVARQSGSLGTADIVRWVQSHAVKSAPAPR